MSEGSPTTASRRTQRSEDDPLIGQVIDGRYRLRKSIARGAMGAVYLAEQMPLARPVAVKLLDPAQDAEEPHKFEERFLREAATLARLQHPNTVRVYDYGRWRGRTFLVMEYVDGYSLRRLHASGPIPPSRLLHIVIQMTGALQEAHSLGLFHRDLKPANVLLTRHPGALDVVKIVDFGLAKGFHDGEAEITNAGQVLGTPMYMAPEQIRDEDCDQRIDVYALGVLLFRGLTGKAPFPKSKTAAVLVAHLNDPVPAFADVTPELDVPPALEMVVRKCMEKNRDDRFANVAELRKALQACVLALEEPSLRHLALSVDDGYTVLPDEVSEASHSSLRIVRHADTSGASGAVAAQPASQGVPVGLFALMVVGMLTAGLLLGMVLMQVARGAGAEQVAAVTARAEQPPAADLPPADAGAKDPSGPSAEFVEPGAVEPTTTP